MAVKRKRACRHYHRRSDNKRLDTGATIDVKTSNLSIRSNADGLPPSQFDHRWRGVWNQLDPQHVGCVSTHHLLKCMGNRAGQARLFSLEVTEKLLDFADRNVGGCIDFDEFRAVVKTGETTKIDKFRRLLAILVYMSVPKTERSYASSTIYMQYKCYPPPLFMVGISLIEIAVFCYYGIVLGGFSANGPLPIGIPLVYDPHRRYEIWRYLSHMFLHVGWSHLAGNVFVQLVVGIPLELVHKFWRLAIIYFLGVLVDTLGTSLTNPYAFMAGASGGVYALKGASLANLILNWAEIEVPFLWLTIWLLVFSTDPGLFWNAIKGLTDATSPIEIVHSAHVFAAVVGMLAGFVVLRNLVQRKWERIMWWFSLAALILLFSALIAWNLVVLTACVRSDCSALTWPGGTTVERSYCPRNFTIDKLMNYVVDFFEKRGLIIECKYSELN